MPTKVAAPRYLDLVASIRNGGSRAKARIIMFWAGVLLVVLQRKQPIHRTVAASPSSWCKTRSWPSLTAARWRRGGDPTCG